jgi:hypothetical protein
MVTERVTRPSSTDLRQLVASQQSEIYKLQARLNFVLSFLGIAEGDDMTVDGSTDSQAAA